MQAELVFGRGARRLLDQLPENLTSGDCRLPDVRLVEPETDWR